MAAVSLLFLIGSAVLYTLSFPPLSWYPLAWVALIPFFIAIVRLRTGYVAVCGVLRGLVMACGVAWCLPGMLMHYFTLSPVASWIGFLAIGIGLSGFYYGIFAAWLSWLARRQAAGPLLIAAGWGTCEFARANLLIGNPWALSGYSQVTWTQLMQIADATGPYGVGMLLAAVNACLAGCFTPALRSRRPILSGAGVVAACGAALVYGEWRLSQSFATGEPIKVAVIQGASEQQNGRNPGHRESRLQRYLTLTKEAGAARPDLIFWPESAVDFPLQNSYKRTAVLAVAQELGADLILGGPHYGYGIADFYHYNSVFLVHGGRWRAATINSDYCPLRREVGACGSFPAECPATSPAAGCVCCAPRLSGLALLYAMRPCARTWCGSSRCRAPRSWLTRLMTCGSAMLRPLAISLTLPPCVRSRTGVIWCGRLPQGSQP